MEDLKELLQELKYNRNINIKNNLENIVDLDYIINRLEDIIKNK